MPNPHLVETTPGVYLTPGGTTRDRRKAQRFDTEHEARTALGIFRARHGLVLLGARVVVDGGA